MVPQLVEPGRRTQAVRGPPLGLPPFAFDGIQTGHQSLLGPQLRQPPDADLIGLVATHAAETLLMVTTVGTRPDG